MAILLLLSLLQTQNPAAPVAPPKPDSVPLEKSAYIAFVDREYIFTVEIVSPGVPLFNFVSMSEQARNLLAKEMSLTLGNRRVGVQYFLVDTGNPKEPVIAPSVPLKPRSSFGVRLQGEFGQEREFLGATIRTGEDEFRLVPLSSFDFENLALKVNKINLGSPDFRDDWRVLKIEPLGSRVRAPRRLPARDRP